ncbi:glycosyltransferase [Halomonas sp. MA07-2]|uniref:glycosyltransferase n=1 Tax=Halomonas sp. MA07-2 TaxID=3440841 RepID=UPI003EEC4E9F
MLFKKSDLAIVNYHFWPNAQIIGETLLRFVEKASLHVRVSVITQSDLDLRKILDESNRASDVDIRSCRSLTDSSSSFFMRVVNSIYFLIWTVINLLATRPKTVYVATNPPLVVPFIVCTYAKIFKAKYYFHVQDIHPEATNIVVPLNRIAFKILSNIDSITLRHADDIITLSKGMADYIRSRSGTRSPITVLDNPAVIDLDHFAQPRDGDVIFCGNAGRLQRIPLIIEAIKLYIDRGGDLRFTFAGGGVYAKDIRLLADSYPNVTYLGLVPTEEAARLLVRHRWGLMPIDDVVTRYAFPSKSSCYLVSGCKILAVCSEETSVGTWIKEKACGEVAKPDVESVVSALQMIETDIASQKQKMATDALLGEKQSNDASVPHASLPDPGILAFYSVERHSDMLLKLVINPCELEIRELDQRSV